MGLAVRARVRGDWPFLAAMLACGLVVVTCLVILGTRAYAHYQCPAPVPVPSVFTPCPGSGP